MAAQDSQDIRYEPDERPPLALSIGLGGQYALLSVAGIVLTPTLMIRIAGGSEAYLSWAVFTALVISGATTVVQAVRIGRLGAGYILLMGSSSAFLAVCVSALEKGGPGLLASLILISAVFQFTLATKLSLFRRIFTPTLAGTVLMLIPITIGPLILGKLTVPEGAARGRPGDRRRHPGGDGRGRAPRHRGLAAVGTRYRDGCGQPGWGSGFWDIRHRARP